MRGSGSASTVRPPEIDEVIFCLADVRLCRVLSMPQGPGKAETNSRAQGRDGLDVGYGHPPYIARPDRHPCLTITSCHSSGSPGALGGARRCVRAGCRGGWCSLAQVFFSTKGSSRSGDVLPESTWVWGKLAAVGSRKGQMERCVRHSGATPVVKEWVSTLFGLVGQCPRSAAPTSVWTECALPRGSR